jgi:ABC-2 type transport system permease protein
MPGQTFFAVVYSLFHTVAILGATVLFFDITLANVNPFTAFVVMLAGSFSFIGFSLVGAGLPLLFPERSSQMTHVIIALLLPVSGVYYPVSTLPPRMKIFHRAEQYAKRLGKLHRNERWLIADF